MSRFTGPRLKVMRALGVDLPGLSRKSIEQRPTPPGQHGAKAVRRKKSDFGIKLMEKQKLRFNYGLSERQLRRLMVVKLCCSCWSVVWITWYSVRALPPPLQLPVSWYRIVTCN